jgi:hypothetical protein
MEQVRQWTANRNNEAGEGLNALGALGSTLDASTPEAQNARDYLVDKMGGAVAGAVKTPGGNWLPNNVEGELKNNLSEGLFSTDVPTYKWLGRRLTNYVKNDLGTANDPLIDMAKQGISHLTPEQLQEAANNLPVSAGRTNALSTSLGVPGEERTPWEKITDHAINPSTVQKQLNGGSPAWMADLARNDPDAPMYRLRRGALDDLGFDHVRDYLSAASLAGDQAARYGGIEGLRSKAAEFAARQPDIGGVQNWQPLANELNNSADLVSRNLHIDASKLPMMSLPDVVRKTADWNKYLAQTSRIQDANTGIKSVLKTYPDTGLNWAELDPSGLGAEGKAMGHCVGGYCPEVANGESRILSLRDSEGQPHVTVEMKRPLSPMGVNMVGTPWYEKAKAIMSADPANVALPEHDFWEKMDNLSHQFWKADLDAGKIPWDINQIKGKGNAKPVQKYMPAVQDLVRNMGPWGDRIGDFHNTGLIHTPSWGRMNGVRFPEGTPKYLTRDEHSDLMKRQGYAEGGWIPHGSVWSKGGVPGMPNLKLDGNSFAQGGHVVNGRLHLDDGGSSGGDGGDGPGDPGTGDPGASGVGVGDVGTSAPPGGDPGVGDPGVMGVAQGQIGTSQPSSSTSGGGGHPSGIAGLLGIDNPSLASVVNSAISMAGHAIGIPSAAMGVGQAISSAVQGNMPAANSTMGSTLGGIIGGMAAGPIGGIVGSGLGGMVGNMPGVPSSSVPADPSGALGMASAAPSSPDPAAQGLIQARVAGSTASDPMGTQRFLPGGGNVAFSGSPAVYGPSIPGNWGTGLQSGWGFARGGRVPGPLTRMMHG